jgi:hypothetical protein
MNKIDVLLNSIAQKHLQVEVLGPADATGANPRKFNNFRIHAALLAAFEGGVRHAANITGIAPAVLIKEVDIDVGRMDRPVSQTREATRAG